jgi:tetratricopeptide (TPR) repeat protein
MLHLPLSRFIFYTCVIFLALSCIRPTVRADSCALTQLTELPIEGSAIGSPIVKILLDDQPRNVLIDTGGFWSLIDPASASAYHPQTAEIGGHLGLGGYFSDRYVVVPSVQLGVFKFFRAGFYLEPSEYGVGVDATLGANWLQAFDLEIDPVRNVVALFTQKHCDGQVVYWPHTDLAELPIKIDHNQKTITVPITLDGQQIEATIDTGSPETYMSMRLAKSLFDLTEKSPGMIERATSTNRFGKTETRYRYQFKSLSIGDVTFIHPMVSLAETSLGVPDLILGMHQLHGLHLYFAYGEKKLYVTSASGDVAARKAVGGGAVKPPLDADPLARINALNLLDAAVAFDRKSDRSAAEGAIEKAISVDPTYAYAYLQRAKFRFEAGKRDDATQDMEKAVTLAPDDPEIWGTRARIYSLWGDNDRAYQDASKVYSLNPNSLSALNARCWFGAIAGHYEAALADCNTAIALDPHATNVLDSRAFVYLRMGKFQDAIDQYSKVLDLDRDMASSYYGRGLANQKVGDKSGGDDDIATAKRIDPDIEKMFGK